MNKWEDLNLDAETRRRVTEEFDDNAEAIVEDYVYKGAEKLREFLEAEKAYMKAKEEYEEAKEWLKTSSDEMMTEYEMEAPQPLKDDDARMHDCEGYHHQIEELIDYLFEAADGDARNAIKFLMGYGEWKYYDEGYEEAKEGERK